MPSVNSAYKRIGDISLPLAGDDVSGTLIIPDPARDNLIELFKAAINDELDEAWGYARQGTPMSATDPVVSTLPMEPTARNLQQWKAAFPLLALHRSGTAEYEERTLWKEQRTQNWELHYILNALDIIYLNRFTAALTYVPTIVAMVIRDRGHKAYQSGALQFGDGLGGLATIRLINTESGSARFSDDESGAQYAACTITLQTTELESDVDGAFTDLTGASFEVGVGGAEGVVPGLIYADTSVPLQTG